MAAQQRVVIGMDPHKRSVTVEVMEADEQIVGHGRFGTDVAGFAQLVAFAGQWPDRVWAIEGCEGIGRHVAQRLVAGGEQVVDVPAKLSARMRMFATGQGRKTDDTDAHSIALVGVRIAGLQPVVSDDQLEMLRLLVDRRRRIGADHTRMICQLHQLLLELVAGGAKKDLSAAQARKILACTRPASEVGKLRKRVALELVVDLERVYLRKKQANKELVALLKTTGTGLLDLRGIGPSGAARLLVEVGDITRFPDRGHFAAWTGTAPIDVSSGDNQRHRLSRGGNRQINKVLHMMAVQRVDEGAQQLTQRSGLASPVVSSIRSAGSIFRGDGHRGDLLRVGCERSLEGSRESVSRHGASRSPATHIPLCWISPGQAWDGGMSRGPFCRPSRPGSECSCLLDQAGRGCRSPASTHPDP